MATPRKRLGSALSQTRRPTDTIDAAAEDGLSDFVSGMQSMALKNARLGVGGPRDQRAYSRYVPTTRGNRVEQESLFCGSWLGGRVISTLPEDMIRPWRKVKWEGLKDDDENVKIVRATEKRTKVKKRLLECSKWARLYGGALLIPVLKSQPDEVLAEPLDYDDIQKDDLVGFHVIDRWRVSVDGDVVTDVLDPENGMPVRYRLAESTVVIHHTRVIRLDGREVPYFVFRANGLWHDSVLQMLISNIKQYDTAMAAIVTMLFQANVDVVLQAGLKSTLSTKNGAEKVIERFRQFAMNKSFNGVGVLDKDTEDYQRHPYSFGGVDRVLTQIMYDVCGAADTPFTRLFGQSPAGMNATGESDDRHYYNHVASRREEHLDDGLAKIDQFVVRSAIGHVPDGYESTWNNPYQETDQEKEQTETTRASRRKLDLEAGIIDEGVAAQDVYDRGVYSGMTMQHVRNAQRVAKVTQERELAPPVMPTFTIPGGGAVPGVAGKTL